MCIIRENAGSYASSVGGKPLVGRSNSTFGGRDIDRMTYSNYLRIYDIGLKLIPTHIRYRIKVDKVDKAEFVVVSLSRAREHWGLLRNLIVGQGRFPRWYLKIMARRWVRVDTTQ